MALVNRIARIFKADFHAVLDHIEEPEALLKQAIRDMEDELAATEQRIAVIAHDQEALAVRKNELERAIADFDSELDLCFASHKDSLARSLIRRKLESERLLKRVAASHATNARTIAEERAALEENTATLESLRQKAELFMQRTPAHCNGSSRFDDIAWMAREMTVDEDEVEIAFLREQSRRSGS